MARRDPDLLDELAALHVVCVSVILALGLPEIMALPEMLTGPRRPDKSEP
jgi:hypothetical protein